MKVGNKMIYSPEKGEIIQIHSYKHNGSIHRIWEKTVVLKGSPHTIVIGANDRTLVREADGRMWLTREPAICYFHAHYWFNIIGMIRKDGIHYYCNISSPFAFDTEALKYIDYDLDIKVFPDMSYILLDEDEYAYHKRDMNYPEAMDRILRNNIHKLIEWIQERRGPFASDFVSTWYARFQEMKQKDIRK